MAHHRIAWKRLLRTGAVAACLAVAGWLVWHNGLRYELFPKRFVAVQPGFLYRSGRISPRLIRSVLEEHEIDLIISLLHYDERHAGHRAERQAAEDLGVELLNFHLRGDGTGDIDHYAQAIAEIARAAREHRRVLVHCAAGSRRTGGVVAAYQLLIERRSPRVAYRELERFNSSPSSRSRLVSFLNAHMAELAARLVERGGLDRLPDPIPQLPQPG